MISHQDSPLGQQDHVEAIPLRKQLFCNRTLNLRSIGAIGYDMDYTLIHYRVEEWERRAFETTRCKLMDEGWPVGSLRFDPHLIIRGLIIDTELGNLVKANRFGHVKRAFHGIRPLDFPEQRAIYSHRPVDLTNPRFVFLNTLFALSEACLYAQLVELLEKGQLPGVVGYPELYRRVRAGLDATHVEGRLKAEIIADPEPFVELDPETPLALLDQKMAGKKLLLITNSEWSYTHSMMSFAFDPFLPAGMVWRDLFQIVIVSARKPGFFTGGAPIFQVVDDSGLLRPVAGDILGDGIYLGGNAAQVERYLRLSGDQILYVGDHLFGDVHVSKRVLQWRTALIAREIEGELEALETFHTRQKKIHALMAEKERRELRINRLQLARLRKRHGYGPARIGPPVDLDMELANARKQLVDLDAEIGPLANESSRLHNPHWGPLMRAGNDKSFFARQVERHASIYTSRVSNFLHHTPFVYLRAPRGSLPHDSGVAELE